MLMKGWLRMQRTFCFHGQGESSEFISKAVTSINLIIPEYYRKLLHPVFAGTQLVCKRMKVNHSKPQFNLIKV